MLQNRCETILFSLATVFNCGEQPSTVFLNPVRDLLRSFLISWAFTTLAARGSRAIAEYCQLYRACGATKG